MIQEQQTYFLEMYRTGARAMSDIANATLENAQRLQEQQSQAMRDALQRNTDGARRLSEARSLGDLLAAQVQLSTAHLQQATDFWTRAWRTAGESQVAIFGKVQNHLGQIGDEMRDSYSAMGRAASDAANQGAESMRDAERRAQHSRKTA